MSERLKLPMRSHCSYVVVMTLQAISRLITPALL